MTTPLPFTDVVGQDDAKLALLLAATDPLLGGVLLRGEKGSAKTTLARGLAQLLGDPFVELPLAATEDRLVGTLDVAAALGEGEVRFHPGLLAQAHGGVLYVDEVNLLADHLVDVLLDVAVSGENRVERDGISHRHPARFVLIGSMNPEEGELRPQLLDRFGLCVEVTAPRAVQDRVEAVRRRLAHDANDRPGRGTAAGRGPLPPTGGDEADLVGRLRQVRPADVPAEVLEAACRLAVEVGAEGLRADLALCRAAAAAAGLDGRAAATKADLERVAPLVLAHRARRRPFDPPRLAPEELAAAWSRAVDDPAPGGVDGGAAPDSGDGPAGGADDDPADGGTRAPEATMAVGAARQVPAPPPPAARADDRGRYVRSTPAADTPGAPVAVLPTARAVAARRSAGQAPRAEDLRAAVHARPPRRLVVLCVDLSGSMGAEDRARAATGTALGLLTDVYERRSRVAVVGFRDDGADVLLAPTTSVEVARNRLHHLATGGRTPLAAGIRTALDLATREPAAPGTAGDEPLLAVLTDGRATGEGDALADALDAAADVRRRRVPALVVDCETGRSPLGLAHRLAEAMGAQHIPAASLEPAALTHAIRSAMGR